MSYHGLGWVDAGSASGSGTNCIGGKPIGKDGSCCPLSGLYNLKYLMLAGYTAHRYFCEVKARRLLTLMASDAEDGSLYEPKLGSAALEPMLRSAITRARRNFLAIYPEGRWHKAPGPAEEHCVYDKFVADPVSDYSSDPGYVAALQDVVSGLPAAERAAGHWALKDPAKALIFSVPGGNLVSNRVGTSPTIGAAMTIKSTSAGNVVQLTPWAKAMLDRMAPRWEGLKLPFSRRQLIARTETEPLNIPKQAFKMAATDEGTVEKDFPWLIVGGAVVVLGGGAAIWYTLRQGG